MILQIPRATKNKLLMNSVKLYHILAQKYDNKIKNPLEKWKAGFLKKNLRIPESGE